MVFDPLILSVISITFLLAGGVKGVIGLGLPTVSLGLLAVALDLTTAMALLIIPSFVTNVWQALTGGNGQVIVKRIWPFLLMATLSIWVGSLALSAVNTQVLSIFLGLLLLAYAALNLFGLAFSVSSRNEKWVGPVFGTINGVFTGMTGSFVVPGVLFLQAIGLSRDHLVQAMGMLFSVSTMALAVALQSNNVLTVELAALSLIAVIPAIMGMMIGQVIRKRLSESLFRRTFFMSIVCLGVFIAGKAAISLS